MIKIKPQNTKNRRQAPFEDVRLYQELMSYKEAGITLWLNGRPSDPKSITDACVAKEDSNYMRDYYSNENDEIYGIGFNKI